MSDSKWLAVIRRVLNTSNQYEAWIYHRPDIRVQAFGIPLTKQFLRLSLDQLRDSAAPPILPREVADAAAGEGQDVMVFYIGSNDPIAPWFENVRRTVRSQTSQAVIIEFEPPGKNPPSREPNIPLVPILEPPNLPWRGNWQFMAALDETYQAAIATIVFPSLQALNEVKVGVIPQSGRDAQVAVASSEETSTVDRRTVFREGVVSGLVSDFNDVLSRLKV